MSTGSGLDAVSDLSVADLARIDTNSTALTKKAMELTDAWGARVVMEPAELKAVVRAVGLPDDVIEALYAKVKSLKYVVEKGTSATGDRAVFTWHGPDATLLILRGATDPGSAFATISDSNLADVIQAHCALFFRIFRALPEYTGRQMFAPDIAARVLSAFGASASPTVLYDLASKLGGGVTEDAEGRKGISSRFIRAATLTLATAL